MQFQKRGSYDWLVLKSATLDLISQKREREKKGKKKIDIEPY
jgi:hypothetical protein